MVGAKRVIILGVILILLMSTFTQMQAKENNKATFPRKALGPNENVLANMTVIWDSFFHKFSIKDLQPKVVVNQSAVRDFYFPMAINGTVEQLNFTIVCRHKLNNSVIIPRYTRVYLALSYNNSYIFQHESINHRCKNLTWDYIDFTVGPDNQLVPLIANGQNLTLTLVVGVFGFPFGFQGITETLEPIVIHPIPLPP